MKRDEYYEFAASWFGLGPIGSSAPTSGEVSAKWPSSAGILDGVPSSPSRSSGRCRPESTPDVASERSRSVFGCRDKYH